jgi:hypothetical protein
LLPAVGRRRAGVGLVGSAAGILLAHAKLLSFRARPRRCAPGVGAIKLRGVHACGSDWWRSAPTWSRHSQARYNSLVHRKGDRVRRGTQHGGGVGGSCWHAEGKIPARRSRASRVQQSASSEWTHDPWKRLWHPCQQCQILSAWHSSDSARHRLYAGSFGPNVVSMLQLVDTGQPCSIQADKLTDL